MTGRLREAAHRVLSLFRRPAGDDLDEELSAHIDMAVADNLRRGMNPAEAARQARVSLGTMGSAKEHVWEQRSVPILETLAADFAYAWRGLRKNPGFTLAAVLTLALGIGANTAIFGIADFVLFRPLPYRDPGNVFLFHHHDKKTGISYTQTPYEQLNVIQEHHTSLSDIGLIEPGDSLLSVTPDGAESIQTRVVTPNYFDILGASAARGRLLTASDADAPGRPAVLTYAMWQQRFGGDESIIGRTVTIGQTSLDVVGVLLPGFVTPTGFMQSAEVITLRPPLRAGEEGGTFHPIVRLNPGVTRERAQAEIDALIAPLVAGDRNPNMTLLLEDVKTVLFPAGRRLMGLLLAAAGLVLFIGCINLAIMLLVRGRRATRETGLRAALGASRTRLVLPVVIESSMIGLAGAALALAVTKLSWKFLLKQVPPIAYGSAPVGVDGRVVLFALGLGLLGGLLFSVIPALRSTRRDAQSLILGRDERVVRRGRIGAPLIALQVAIAVVLVFGAATVGRAFVDLLNEPLGFDPQNVITMRVFPAGLKGLASREFYMRAMETLSARPDVISAGATGQLPLDGTAPNAGLLIDGQGTRAAGLVYALPGYFETARIPLLRGRLFDASDVRSSADVAVIGESAARALHGPQDPIGKTFENSRGRTYRIVGVVADTKRTGTMESPVYPLMGDAFPLQMLIVRTRGHEDSTLNAIRREVAQLASNAPVRAAWWSDSLSELYQYRTPRFQTLVLGTFGGLALGLTALGIFAVVAFSVAIRTREVGIRMAIGARPRSVEWLMMRQSLLPVIAGLGAGVALTQWAAGVAETQLPQLASRSPVGLAAAAITVIAAALLAAYFPARRASRVDPAVVLRVE